MLSAITPSQLPLSSLDESVDDAVDVLLPSLFFTISLRVLKDNRIKKTNNKKQTKKQVNIYRNEFIIFKLWLDGRCHVGRQFFQIEPIQKKNKHSEKEETL